MPDAAAPRPFQIFVSSPGDLGEERLICARVIESLKAEFARVARLEAILWEQEPLTADAGFQEQIVLPSQTDIVVILIWSRLGCRVHSKFKQEGDAEAPTGTIFEFRDALDARRRNPAKTPDMMVYRKLAEPPKPSITDREAYLKTLDDYERVEAFFNSAFFKDANDEGAFTGAFHTFKRSSEFADNFERHIRAMITRRLGDQTVARSERWKRASPFRGLQAFDFEHRDLFAGRVRASMEVRETLRRQAGAGRAFVLVMGMTGGGKSSLVKAGVLPDLVQPGVIEGVGLWRRIVFRPSAIDGDLLEGFAAILLQGDRTLGLGLPELSEDETTPASLAARLRESPVAAVLVVEGGLRHAADAERVTQRERLQGRRRELDAAGQFDEIEEIDRALEELKLPKARLALVIDQLEEVFTDPRFDDAARSAFIAVIGALARGGRTWVIATLRSDFFARCEQIPELVALKEGDGTYHLLAPNEAEISQMIRYPARSTGLEYEKDGKSGESLADALLVAATRQPGSLPLLEFTLDELYKRSEAAARPTLTFADYRALGGLEGAIAQRAEEVFAAIAQRDPRAAAALPPVFAALVRVTPESASGGAVSAAMPRERFREVPGGPELVNALIEARLLVSDQGEVRVAHEALLEHWPRLREWIVQNGEFLLTRARLRAAALRWEAENRAADYLLPKGKPLIEAESIHQTRRADLTPNEAAFVAASSEARRREERAAARQRRRVMVALASAALLCLGFALVSLFLYRQAGAEARRAVQARLEAEDLVRFISGDLTKKLKPLGRLDLLESANRRVRLFYERDAGQSGTSDTAARKAAALRSHGEILRARGMLEAALARFREAEELCQSALKLESTNEPCLAELGLIEERLGAALRASGDLVRAIACLRSSVQHRQQLVTAQPEDVERNRELAAAWAALGHGLAAEGDWAAALRCHEDALAIDSQNVRRAPGNPEVLHDQSVSLLNVADVRVSRAEIELAIPQYTAAIEILENIGSRDPPNAQWRRNHAVALEHASAAQWELGRPERSLALQQQAQVLFGQLKESDPTNLDRQRDLFVSRLRLGDLWLETDPSKASLEFAEAKALQEVIVGLDRTNAQAQLHLTLALERLAQVDAAAGRTSAAEVVLSECVRERSRLAALDPANGEWALALSEALMYRGDVSVLLGKREPARQDFSAAMEIANLLAGPPGTAEPAMSHALQVATRLAEYWLSENDVPTARKLVQNVIALRPPPNELDKRSLAFLRALLAFDLVCGRVMDQADASAQVRALLTEASAAANALVRRGGPRDGKERRWLEELTRLRNLNP